MVFSNGTADIEYDCGSIVGNCLMWHIGRDEEHRSWFEGLCFITNREFQFALKQDTSLLMGVVMKRDHCLRVHFQIRQH